MVWGMGKPETATNRELLQKQRHRGTCARPRAKLAQELSTAELEDRLRKQRKKPPGHNAQGA